MASQRYSSFVIGTKRSGWKALRTSQPPLSLVCFQLNTIGGTGRSVLVLTWVVQVFLCASCLLAQCLTGAYRYRTQGTVSPECSILLICRIFVSALLLLLDCHFEIGCEDIQFSRTDNGFLPLFFRRFFVIHFVYKKSN